MSNAFVFLDIGDGDFLDIGNNNLLVIVLGGVALVLSITRGFALTLPEERLSLTLPDRNLSLTVSDRKL
jgi:hypothetical protein